MSCEQWRGQIDTYLDGELESSKSSDLMAHLRTCPACTAQILEKVQLKRSIQSAGKRYVPSAEFRSRMQKSIAQKSSARKPTRWSLALIPAFALILAVLFVGNYVIGQRDRRAQVYGELADVHVATLASPTPVDVVSTDRHTVKPWFQGKIPFSFNLPELGGSPFTLLGGRVFYLEQTSGAHLIYQLRKHEISVFILPERAAAFGMFSLPTAKQLPFQTKTWSQGGLQYFVLGDVSTEDIGALTKLLQGAN